MEKVSFHFGSSVKNSNSKSNNDPIQITLKKEPEKIAENIFSFSKNVSSPTTNTSAIKSDKRPTICFATMCKDEEHCIKETLENVHKYIDYWVVCDTGSSDNTCKIVEEFFKEKNIPGELHVDEWKGFDVNKTMLFNYCYKKTDYILHLDADDLLVGDFEFTNEDAGAMSYLCWCKRGDNSTTRYKVQFMFNNNYHWKFCGVAHTTIRCLDGNENIPHGDLTDKNFFLNSRDTGNRSNDPEKYYKDALKLTDQFYKTLLDDPDNLNARSAFYTAQSYRDSRRFREAAQWYTLYTRLTNTWFEETYESYLNLGRLFDMMKMSQNKIISVYESAIEIIPDRAEAYLELGRYLNVVKQFDRAYDILSQGRKITLDQAKSKYKLFVNDMSYGKFFDDDISVSCYWLGKYDEGKKMLLDILDDPDFARHKERLNANMVHFNNAMMKRID
jgi:glycosyltransferase involved in cell wall biosynthesis